MQNEAGRKRPLCFFLMASLLVLASLTSMQCSFDRLYDSGSAAKKNLLSMHEYYVSRATVNEVPQNLRKLPTSQNMREIPTSQSLLELPVSPRLQRLSGLGCSMSMCSNATLYEVGGVKSQPMPHVYVVIPMRNRMAFLARLLSSFNTATTPSMRACICVIIADHESSLSSLPSWQNPACVATLNTKYNIYMQEDDFDVYKRPLHVCNWHLHRCDMTPFICRTLC